MINIVEYIVHYFITGEKEESSLDFGVPYSYAKPNQV